MPLTRLPDRALVQGGALLRLPVVDVESGKRVARLCDIAFDPTGGPLIALQTQSRRGQRRWQRPEEFVALGPDAILMRGQTPADYSLPELREHTVIGLRVMTRGGRLLGEIADVLFDARRRCVWGYALSNGTLYDLWEGRRALACEGGGQWRFADVCLVGERIRLYPLSFLLQSRVARQEETEERTGPLRERSRMSLRVDGQASATFAGQGGLR